MDRNKNTALHVAALNGDIDMVAGLLDKRRFRIESKNIYGQTPLMFAAMAGEDECSRSASRERGENSMWKISLAGLL